MSKVCAIATLRESLAWRLQMSGGPSNDSMQELGHTGEAHNQHHYRNRYLIKKRVQRNSTVSTRINALESGRRESVDRIAKQGFQLKHL